MNSVQQNLLILFLLLPMMLSSWWFFIWLKNRIMGFDIKEVYALIYTNPIAAAILRVGIMACTAWLIGIAYGRVV